MGKETKKPSTTSKKTSEKDVKFKMEAYSVTAKKTVEVTENARITKTSRNAFMLRGEDSEGNKVAAIVKEEKALYWIEKGMAEKDF